VVPDCSAPRTAADRRRVGRPVRQPAGPGARCVILTIDGLEAAQSDRRQPVPPCGRSPL